jgi:hypothetical protein
VRANSSQLGNTAYVDQEARREKMLAQGGDQVGTAGHDLRIRRVLRELVDGFGERARPEKLEIGQRH